MRSLARPGRWRRAVWSTLAALIAAAVLAPATAQTATTTAPTGTAPANAQAEITAYLRDAYDTLHITALPVRRSGKCLVAPIRVLMAPRYAVVGNTAQAVVPTSPTTARVLSRGGVRGVLHPRLCPGDSPRFLVVVNLWYQPSHAYFDMARSRARLDRRRMRLLLAGPGFVPAPAPSGPFAVLSTVTGMSLSPMTALVDDRSPGTITSIVADGRGGWIIGGSFTSVDGVPRASLARITPDLTLDRAWRADVRQDVPTSVPVYGMATANGTLYIHGRFDRVSGEPRRNIAAIDLASGGLSPWQPQESFFVIRDIAAADGRVFVSGIPGQPDVLPPSPVHYVVTTLDGSTGAAVANITTDTGDDEIVDSQDLQVRGDRLYVFGSFSTVGGNARSGLAALDLNTGALSPWSPVLPPDVFAQELAATDSAVYVVVTNKTLSGSATLMSFDPATGERRPWAPAVGGSLGHVFSLLAGPGGLWVAGKVSGRNSRFLSVFDLATGVLRPRKAPLPDGTVQALALQDNRIALGGGFSSLWS